MLRPGFLRTLSDWVSERYAKHPREMDKAAEEFELARLAMRSPEPDMVAGLFSEWLVFDQRSKIFSGKTGLEYFVEHNPAYVSDEDLAAYRDMLQYKVGMFSLKSVDGGRNVTLEDMPGNSYVVHDVTASMHLTHGAVWTRIASVGGIYQMVGSLFIPLPLVFGAGFKKAAASWGERSMDAREAAALLSSTPNREKISKIMEHDPSHLTREECARRRIEYRKKFEEALRACDMQDMISADLYEKWLTDERRFSLGFAAKAIFFLVPEHASDRDSKRLIDIAMHYGNYVSRKALKGRCPSEMRDANPGFEQDRLIEQDILTREPYLDPLMRAHEYMAAHEWHKGYDTFVSVIEDFLKDKVPASIAFRVYANAAIACFNEGDARFALGEEILLASLRLNPQYDFGQRLKREKVDPLDDFSDLPKGISRRDVPLIKDMRAIVKKGGERQYRRTVFRKYEDFLKKCGISLSCTTRTTPTVLPDSGQQKQKRQGRNESCLCGSGKKYKKCCGGPGTTN